MVCASKNEVGYLKEVLPAITGVIFLATPHRGSTAASLGKIAYQCSKILAKKPNTKLLESLEQRSEILDRISTQFLQLLSAQDILIHSFIEELPTQGMMV
jgi:protein SERAC1